MFPSFPTLHPPLSQGKKGHGHSEIRRDRRLLWGRKKPPKPADLGLSGTTFSTCDLREWLSR